MSAYVHPKQATRISRTDDDNFKPSETCPTPDLAGMRIGPCCPSILKGKKITQEKVITVAGANLE